MPLLVMIAHKADTFVLAVTAQLTVTLGCAVFILLCEVVVLGFERSSVRSMIVGDGSARRDLISYVLDVTGILRLMGHAVTLGAGFLIGLAIKNALDLQLAGLITNEFVQVPLVFLINAFFAYWTHRAMHAVPALWEIHKYHHSATEMNVLTAHRESILIAPFTSIAGAIPIGLLGASMETFVVIAVLTEFHALLIHSRLRFDLGWLGDRLIISSNAHRIHHALDKEHRDRNFGFTLSVWDYVFGTYARLPTRQPIAIGTEGDVYNHVGWHREMLYSVRSAIRQGRRLRGSRNDAAIVKHQLA